MTRVRRPSKVALPTDAYVDMTDLSVPECVADLEVVPGRCWSAKSAVRCSQSGPDVVCTECCMVELGESLELFNVRTNQGIPKAKFYRDLDRAQSMPDPSYRRMMAWKRNLDARG